MWDGGRTLLGPRDTRCNHFCARQFGPDETRISAPSDATQIIGIRGPATRINPPQNSREGLCTPADCLGEIAYARPTDDAGKRLLLGGAGWPG